MERYDFNRVVGPEEGVKFTTHSTGVPISPIEMPSELSQKLSDLRQESNDQKAMIKQQQREIESLKERLKRFADHSKMDYPQVGEA